MTRFKSTLVVSLGLAVLAGCRTAAPTSFPTSEPQASPGEGQLVVATTANYAPFEYYDEELALAGFDIDVMNAIGRELGKEVVFEDYAFDGLIPTLQLGQVQAVIAALSVTAERDAKIDFSDVYYVGADAALGRADMPAGSLTSAADLAPLRVGVENGSVYHEWLEKELVDAGAMAAGNIFAYGTVDQAVSDLRADRLDLVLLDRDAADPFLGEGDVHIVAEGVNPQRFAIGVRGGDDALREAINGALANLQMRGEIAQLAARYELAAESGAGSTPTEAPATPEPPPPCMDGMTVLESLTLDDRSFTAPPIVPPGEVITKTWRIENSGTCAWNEDYRAVFGSGNVPAAEMGGEPVSVVGTVASGATYDLSVVLVAPLEPGIYQAMWEMRNAEDVSFGERLALAVQVPERPTATPAPTQTPVPDVMFTAEPTTVKPGEQVLFQWSAPGAKGVYFYAEGRDWAQFPVENTGRRAVWPDASITYYLRVITDGGIEQRSIRIEVVPVANAPTITYFSVLPEGTMALGQCAAIQWNVQGDVTKVAVYANSTAIWDGAPLSGYMPHCPPGTGTIVYAVEAVGPGGTARLQHELTVAASGGNPPPPSGGPVITAFSATPDRLPAGSCTRIYWKVGGDFNRVRLLRNTQVVLDNAPPTGDTEDCSYDKGTFVYGVTASNAAGQTASRDATVVFE